MLFHKHEFQYSYTLTSSLRNMLFFDYQRIWWSRNMQVTQSAIFVHSINWYTLSLCVTRNVIKMYNFIHGKLKK